MDKIKQTVKPRIGVYTMGLKTYWPQFAGLRERLLKYGQFIADKVEAMNSAVLFYGIAEFRVVGNGFPRASEKRVALRIFRRG